MRVSFNILVITNDNQVQKTFKLGFNQYYSIEFLNNVEEVFLEETWQDYDLVFFDASREYDLTLMQLNNFRMSRSELLNRSIVISENQDINEEIEFHTIGVRDFISKPLNTKLLRAITEKHIFAIRNIQSHIIDVGPFSIHLGELSVTIDKENGGREQVDLSLKEFLLLKYLLINKNRVLSRQQIIEDVWSLDSETMSRTIDIYISNLRKKIVPYDKCILTKRGIGYIFKWD